MRNFKGEEIVEGPEPFILHEYLRKHGLFASRVRFYLLTEKKDFDTKAESKHGDSIDNEEGDDEGEQEEEDGANTYLTLSVAGLEIQHIIDVQFISVVISIYSGLPSSLGVIVNFHNELHNEVLCILGLKTMSRFVMATTSALSK